jgi:hypothetical protein
VFGADKRGWNDAWLQQGFEFSERKTEVEGEHAPVTESFRYGFEQHKGGSCGVLAVVQAHVVANLLFKGAAETSSASALLDAADDQRAAALGQALADVLWKSSDGKQATVVSAPAECKFQAANLKTLLTATLLTSKKATVAFFKANLARFQSHGGVVLFLYSVILTRGVDNIAADQDTPGPLMGAHAYCSQDMVNLLLSGKAVTNVFDGEQKLDSTTLSGFTEQQEVGFLTLFEHHQHMTVGENLKNPVYPVWVVNSESHYTLLFALEPLTAEATSVNLLHFDQLGKQTDEYKLTVDTSSEQPAERDEELEPPINDVVRTRWGANATIDWNGAEAPL